MLVTSSISFSHHIFYPFPQNNFNFSVWFILSSANAFNWVEHTNLLLKVLQSKFTNSNFQILKSTMKQEYHQCQSNHLTLYSIDTHFEISTTDSFWKHSGKRTNERFLLFPQCFLLNQIIVSPFVHIFDTISLFSTELEEPKIGISGKGLTLYKTTTHF